MLQIQNAAYRMTERRNSTITTTLRDKFLGMLRIARRAKNTEKVNEIIGQILYIVYKLVRNKTNYNNRSKRTIWRLFMFKN